MSVRVSLVGMVDAKPLTSQPRAHSAPAAVLVFLMFLATLSVPATGLSALLP